MPDYIYLLEHRLSPSQREAVRIVRDAARDESMTVFLTGGAVRDLTTGSPVRDLDFSVQGNALKLKKRLSAGGGSFWGEHAASQTLFFAFPGSVRVEIASTRREEFPKPGKPEYIPDTILEDLRRRDFTANAMALSLNDMSFGLLMDPLNGVADIEARTLRLVSNYGFLESPVRLLRAVRLGHRLAWQMDEKTQTRFQNAMDEGMMQQLSAYDKGYELEEIGHEENPLETLKALEAAGWMKEVCPAWTAACADVSGLEQMHEILTRLQMQGVYPDASTVAMELLTARMKPKDLESLKKMFVRQGFVKDWERLDKDAEEFSKLLTSKEMAAPSATWKLFQTANPAAILWLGLTGKGSAAQAKYKNFFMVWPESKQQVPTAIMQEMRITPELPRYAELLGNYFYELIDGKLKTDEDIRAFLEPYSPPAPPPPVNVRRGRAAKKAEKSDKKVVAAAVADTAADADEDGEDDGAEAAVSAPVAAKKTAKPAVKKTAGGEKAKDAGAALLPEKVAAPVPAATAPPAKPAAAPPAPAKSIAAPAKASASKSVAHAEAPKVDAHRGVHKAPARAEAKAGSKTGAHTGAHTGKEAHANHHGSAKTPAKAVPANAVVKGKAEPVRAKSASKPVEKKQVKKSATAAKVLAKKPAPKKIVAKKAPVKAPVKKAAAKAPAKAVKKKR